MKLILIICLTIFCTVVYAKDKEHFELATKFELLSSAQNKNKLVQQIFPVLKKSLGLTDIKSHQKYDEIIERYLVDILQSKEYEEGKVNVYMKIYSKEELKKLIKLVSTPEYQLLQEKRVAISTGLIQNMNGILQKTLPSLDEKIKAAK